MVQVLIVSSDATFVDRARAAFAQLELSTAHVDDAASALEVCRGVRSSVLLLADHRLPDMTGVELCSMLRGWTRTASVPVLLLGERPGHFDSVVAFEVGADDYLCKPVAPRELALRARALARRFGICAASPTQVETIRSAEGLEIHCDSHEVHVAGQLVSLTRLEFRLLDTLVQRRGRLQSRARLLEDVWGFDAEPASRTVDTHIKRLREKLGPSAKNIETVRGLGYRFSD